MPDIERDEWELERSIAALMNNYTPQEVDAVLDKVGGKEVLAIFLEWLPEVH